jgi:hypothetical protein
MPLAYNMGVAYLGGRLEFFSTGNRKRPSALDPIVQPEWNLLANNNAPRFTTKTFKRLRETFKYLHNNSKEQPISTMASEGQGVTSNIWISNPMQKKSSGS